jgi:hypothetical protein
VSVALVISLTVVVENPDHGPVITRVMTQAADELVKHGVGCSLSLNPTGDEGDDD